jgi:hypothetical protein
MRRHVVWLLVLAGCAQGADSEFVPPGVGSATTGDDGVADSGPGTGSDTGAGTGPSTTGGAESSGAPADGTTTDVEPAPPWLVSIDDQGAAARLVRVDTNDASTTDVCELPSGRNYNSLMFTRDGDLLAYSVILDMIQRIDPCTCAAADLMAGLGNLQISGGRDAQVHAFTVATSSLYRLDVSMMSSLLIGPVNVASQNLAIAWSDPLDALYLLASDSDELYFLDPESLTTSLIGSLGTDFTSVGLDYHPGLGQLFACTGTGDLLRIDTNVGTATVVGNLGFAQCDNLAAPWAPVACI